MWIANMKFDCRFNFSRLPLRLQHRAVELAEENSLGDFLFPTPETVCSRDSPIIPLDQLSDIKYVKLVQFIFFSFGLSHSNDNNKCFCLSLIIQVNAM